MAFHIVGASRGRAWKQVDYGSGEETMRVGQMATNKVAATQVQNGVKHMIAASGAADTTLMQIPCGVVIGTNNMTPVSDTTYKTDYITSVTSQANQVARSFFGAEGSIPKGDPAAAVLVELIGPETLIRGDIFLTTYGVAPTLLTATAVAGSGNGSGTTTNSCGFAGTLLDSNKTLWCRKGLNQGLKRIASDTSLTTHTFDLYWPYTMAVGDQYVAVGLREGSGSFAQFDSEGMFIDTAGNLSSYFVLDVEELNLETAGQEHCLFRFNPIHFCAPRA